MTRSFLRALASGVGASLVIGFGLMITMIVFDATSGSGGESLFFLVMIFMFTILSGTLTGALLGSISARHAPSRLSASGAGALTGLIGQFMIIVMMFTAAGIIAASDSGSDTVLLGDGEESSALEWSEFGQALLFLVPATFVAALVAPLSFTQPTGEGMVGAPWSKHSHDSGAGHDDHHTAGPDAPLDAESPPPAGARKLRCPECSTVIHVARGDPIRCNGCGLTGRSPA